MLNNKTYTREKMWRNVPVFMTCLCLWGFSSGLRTIYNIANSIQYIQNTIIPAGADCRPCLGQYWGRLSIRQGGKSGSVSEEPSRAILSNMVYVSVWSNGPTGSGSERSWENLGPLPPQWHLTVTFLHISEKVALWWNTTRIQFSLLYSPHFPCF